MLIRVLTDACEHKIALRYGPVGSAKTTLMYEKSKLKSRRVIHRIQIVVEEDFTTRLCCGTGTRSSEVYASWQIDRGKRKARLTSFASLIK